MINILSKIAPAIALTAMISIISVSAANAQSDQAQITHTWDPSESSTDFYDKSTMSLLTQNGFSIGVNSMKNQITYKGMKYTFDNIPDSVVSDLNTVQKDYLNDQCKRQSWADSRCERFELTAAEEIDRDKKIDEQQTLDAGGYALKVFAYAMGEANGDGNGCITCTFLGNFMLGLASFSVATFFYFQKAFMTLVPVIMAVWIGWRVSKLLVTGGEDGRSFIYNVAGKMSLLFLAWAFISMDVPAYGPVSPDQKPPYSWNLIGPEYLKFAFGLSTEIRESTLTMQSNITSFSPGMQKDAFKCTDTVEFMKKFTTQQTLAEFSGAAIDVACATERTHMVGFSSGLAIIGSATSQFALTDIQSMGHGIVKLISGFFMLFIFGLSAVWFTFLVLDIVVRGMITAAFLPFIMASLLFNPTRYIAVNALKSLAGAIMTAVAIGIISTLAFFLLTNTVEVYNALAAQLDPIYPFKLTVIEQSSSIDAFREFIIRIQETRENSPRIPMDLTTPWFYYLVLCGLAIFALGKKIISMLEGMIGTSGMSTMADNAMKMTRTSLGLGMAAGNVAANSAAFAGRSGVALTGAMVGAGKGPIGGFIKNTVNPFGANSSGMGMSGGLDTRAMMETMQSGADVPPGE